MDIKDLMSGIAVVIDDAEKDGSADKKDKIFELVKRIENEWKIPFYKTHEIPSDEIVNNLLQSASFILLDWKLWPSGAKNLERNGIASNINFLKQAKDYFVPVFIFTNESKDDITDEISELYDKDNPERNFIFIKNKTELASGISDPIRDWLQGNASVYTLKTWEQTFYKAKRNLFGSMYEKSPDWPRVFWSSYKDDGADPSFSMVGLINSNLFARMETDIFEEEVLGAGPNKTKTDSKDLKSVLEGASFIPHGKLPRGDIKSGDIFKENSDSYLINIRADCDCIPRKGQSKDNIELYCIEGKRIEKKELKKLYKDQLGNFDERVWQAIVFTVHGGETVIFDLKKLVPKKFSEVENKRVGRLIHPYITRIQQRYSAYLQRQGLPRIPREAIEIDDGT